jgi:hypothetical protein
MNYGLSQTEQLVDLLFNAVESIDDVSNKNVFLDWEVFRLYIETSNGLKINLETKIIDPSGTNEYITWKKIRDMIKIFFDTNSLMGITIDIRMRLPKDLKLEIDPNGDYHYFNLSFYSKNEVVMVSTTAVEKNLSSSYKPVEQWNDYISNIINVWKLKKGIA